LGSGFSSFYICMKKVEKKERKGDRLLLSKRRLLFPYVKV
jgi:hypothetical protein